ncbi:MAG: hypothetical protein IJX20_03630, partial [Alphaproteobacteria bacterium]|nr:hypothetical protein [Alphaproteobacteria bacterium]
PLAGAEFVLIVELHGKTVERTYAVPVENVEDVVFKGRQTRPDELVKAKTKEELLADFGAIRCWTNGSEK